jgi:hypothetical protein
MAIIQIYRGHYVQLAVDRKTQVITAIATKRGGRPIFFNTVSRGTVELQGPPGLPGLDDARAAVMEALASPQAEVVFAELQRVLQRVKTPPATRYESRHNV